MLKIEINNIHKKVSAEGYQFIFKILRLGSSTIGFPS